MAKLSDLLKRRKDLANRSAHTARELEAVDNEILKLVERARSALIGDEQRDRNVVTAEFPWVDGPNDRKRYFYTSKAHEKRGREPSLQRPILEVLHRLGHALNQKDLLNMLVQRGVKVKGKKPRNTLSAHVSYLVKKGVLMRDGDLVALKQATLPGTTNENATKTH